MRQGRHLQVFAKRLGIRTPILTQLPDYGAIKRAGIEEKPSLCCSYKGNLCVRTAEHECALCKKQDVPGLLKSNEEELCFFDNMVRREDAVI